MPQEIERKFLVRGDFKAYACQSFRIVQGYLSSVPERTVRIRVKGEQGYLTVKVKVMFMELPVMNGKKRLPGKMQKNS